ncbi:Coenzyme F420 hydrogenase/dehydrogenase, beta subunit C-terminal domain [Segatella bryantii]|uniref:Coenzyme F420 hydrogenase/dehydrogenase, beta subunit C-terminal domain n=1 Tax=Segatella bryantii TaxID=77095 RepID=UPI00247A1CEE|nr:Coenzyme F420 hydrogenase/dehydrogenase, beta subunit C-terminal domain [Segatella bryantii]
MINIQNKVECCGCNACGDICAHKAITFKTDIEGFWYPEVNKDLCTNCGLCEKVCPIINIKDLKKNDYPKPSHTIAAVHKNMRVRWNSTSGGAYTALAETMLEKGGYISGAIYNEGFTGVHNYVTNNPEDLEKLRSSKYLQSNAQGLFIRINELLKKGEKVLACGTPCQMAALRSSLRKDFENLIIVDFICRGVNSPKVYRAYLDSLEKKYGSKVVYVKAKNKELGWRNLTRKVTFENGQSYYGVFMDDDFRRGYHTNVFCRPSCYECQFKEFPRISDITIADYWGIEKVDKNLDMNIGTSMILLNSDKGAAYFEQAKEKLEYKETSFESILGGNIALRKSIEPAKIDRVAFFKDLDNYDFNYVTNKYFPLKRSTKLIFVPRVIVRKCLGLIKQLLLKLKSKILHPSTILKTYYINHRINTIREGGNIYIEPNTVLDIHSSAKINVYKDLILGRSEIKGLHYHTALKMEAGTELNIHGGPLTRYGNGPYLLRSGACIEIVHNGKLTIGQGACNVNLTIMCAKEITIGNGVRIGRNVSIRDYNGVHVIVSDTYKNYAPVNIGDHCWLCTGCTIMPGVSVGEGSVVAANAVVTKDVPPHSLVAGSPAKVIKNNIEWY